ncbi:MAG TPA: MFS transporter [Kiritimatiellia bacterium]|nr:MFS transporter [Kiritimatiellia bacterium]HRU70365.1 MFS transporter [Kiritimatiellia bacterium]
MSIRRHFKWFVCAFLFLAVAVLYMDRQALSILAPQLSRDHGWSETDYGNMVAAYQFAYAAGVLAVGWIIDRLGTRLGFGLFVLLWSLAIAAHGWAASATAFIAVRLALGLTQAGCFPCAIKATAEWFPKEERAFAIGIFNTGSMIGPILAPLVILFLYAHAGWLATCLGLGAAGIAWSAVWLVSYHTPGSSPAQDEAPEGPPLPLAGILSRRATWAFVLGKLLSDPVWWFFLYWLPKFLHDKHGVALTNLGAPLVTIYSITMIGSVGAGWLTRRLTAGGVTVRSSRRIVMLLCALLPLPVLTAARTGEVWLAVVLIGLATAGHSGWMANLFALVSDHFPKNAVASVTGIGTTAGALGGIGVARLAGWILDSTGSYWPLFVMSACAYVVAWLVVHSLLPGKAETV